jgi:hypothetical protein
VEVGEVLEGRVGGLVHGDGGLAEGEDQDLIEFGEGKGLVRKVESAGVVVEVAADGGAHVDVAHGLGEDGAGLLGERTHAAALGVVWEELSVMMIGLRGEFNTALARRSCGARGCLTKVFLRR